MLRSALQPWISAYAQRHRDLLVRHPEFASWLQEEYVPIFGGWQY